MVFDCVIMPSDLFVAKRQNIEAPVKSVAVAIPGPSSFCKRTETSEGGALCDSLSSASEVMIHPPHSL